MSKKTTLALLVVLALGLVLVAVPAGSATLHSSSTSDESVVDVSSLAKEGDDGESGGDDDRWGNTSPMDNQGGATSGDGDDVDGEGEMDLSARRASLVSDTLFGMRLRVLFSFLVLLF